MPCPLVGGGFEIRSYEGRKICGRPNPVGARHASPCFFIRADDLLRWARCWQHKDRILFFHLWQGDL